MKRLAEIESHIGSIDELRDLVGALRSLAGMRLQEAQRTLPGIRGYAETIAAAIVDCLLLVEAPEPPGDLSDRPKALVLCTAEHGFVGGFNERLVAAAGVVLRRDDLLFVLGSRGAALVLERGRRVAWEHPMASRAAAVTETIQSLSDALFRSLARGVISRVELMYTRSTQGTAATIERVSLLPIDTAALDGRQIRQKPLHNLDPAVLQEKLMAEYVFALLAEAAVESIASENAARFAAMQSAHDGVSAKLDGLRSDARQARQWEITTELLDIVTGAEAMSGRE